MKTTKTRYVSNECVDFYGFLCQYTTYKSCILYVPSDKLISCFSSSFLVQQQQGCFNWCFCLLCLHCIYYVNPGDTSLPLLRSYTQSKGALAIIAVCKGNVLLVGCHLDFYIHFTQYCRWVEINNNHKLFFRISSYKNCHQLPFLLQCYIYIYKGGAFLLLTAIFEFMAQCQQSQDARDQETLSRASGRSNMNQSLV